MNFLVSLPTLASQDRERHKEAVIERIPNCKTDRKLTKMTYSSFSVFFFFLLSRIQTNTKQYKSIALPVCLHACIWVLPGVHNTNRTTIHSWNHCSKGLPVVDVDQLSNRRCFILYLQNRSLSVEWLPLLLLRSHCVSHTVCSTSGFGWSCVGSRNWTF